MAAGVLLALGVTAASLYQSAFRWDSIDAYIVDHWAVDGTAFVELADGQPVNPTTAAELFASYGVEVSPALAGSIDILGACRTPGSRGAHMVVHTDQGPVTVIFMPKVASVDGHTLAFEGLLAQTLQLEKGSAVIIGPTQASIDPVYAMTRDGIRPISNTG
jgi:hypothetical protein